MQHFIQKIDGIPSATSAVLTFSRPLARRIWQGVKLTQMSFLETSCAAWHKTVVLCIVINEKRVAIVMLAAADQQ